MFRYEPFNMNNCSNEFGRSSLYYIPFMHIIEFKCNFMHSTIKIKLKKIEISKFNEFKNKIIFEKFINLPHIIS